RRCRPAATGEDRHPPRVVPVVEDVAQQVGGGPNWHRREKVPAHEAATVGHPRRRDGPCHPARPKRQGGGHTPAPGRGRPERAEAGTARSSPPSPPPMSAIRSRPPKS